MKKIICGDCLYELNNINEGSVDLIILDPSYNDWDKMNGLGLIKKSLTILKPEGNILCFTKQPFDYNLRQEINNIFRREIVWTFTNGGAWVSNKMPLVSSQKIYWCIKSKDFYFNPRTGSPYSDKTKTFKRKNKVFEGYDEEGKDFIKSEEGVWLRDHLHFNKPHTGKMPSKPEELIKILVKCFCPKGGIVVDPFMGSGVVGKVCENLKINYIGIDIVPENCK